MKILALIHKRVDAPGLLVDVLDQIVEPMLDRIVANTKNTFDDSAKALVYPLLKKEAEGLVRPLWDKLAPPAPTDTAGG